MAFIAVNFVQFRHLVYLLEVIGGYITLKKRKKAKTFLN